MINTDPKHQHTYNEHGEMTCCSLEEKVNLEADERLKEKGLSTKTTLADLKEYIPAISSFILLLSALLLDHIVVPTWFNGYMRIVWYAVAYLPVGLPVVIDALKAILRKDVFSEFFLMSIATIGAFAIGEYPEGVAVMLFYAVGELFQSAAVKRAKGNIKALLDVRPDSATVLRNGSLSNVKPESVVIGETIQVKAVLKLL